MTVLFEGTEKKFELNLGHSTTSLLSYNDTFWQRVVEKSHAKILNQISNSKQKAFLLSESSLFVTDHRLVMITCGQTKLAQAAAFVLNELNCKFESFFYERKNEFFPRDQRSCFVQDCKLLNPFVQGEALRFGSLDQHHLNLFCSQKKCQSHLQDQTVEILMYGLSPKLYDELSPLQKDKSKLDALRELLCKILPFDFVDDYVFSPTGYSLNGIKDQYYTTIHVTPENICSYASFETNFPLSNEQVKQLQLKLYEIFTPSSFDVVLFSSQDQEHIQFPNFNCHSDYKQKLENNYFVNYSHYYRPSKNSGSATRIEVS